MSETILVVGASGKFAGLVVPELARRGADIPYDLIGLRGNALMLAAILGREPRTSACGCRH